MRTPCGLAFEDERAEGRAIVRVYILDPAALATSSQALVSFWPNGEVRAGTLQAPSVLYIIIDRIYK